MGVFIPLIPAILTRMPARMNLHLVSDATGETLNSIARATVSQFEHANILYHRWSLIRTRFQLHRVLEGIEAEPGPVLSTLVEKSLRAELETFCQRIGLPVVNVLDPVMSMFQEQFGEKAAARPGRQYVLDADYFRRIDAMHYVLAHDDGQAQAGIAEADVVLVGVSRSSQDADLVLPRQPRHQGGQHPAGAGPAGTARAGEPALPGDRPDHRCRGADRNPPPPAAHDRRRAGAQDSGDYVDLDAVKAELLWARRLCVKRGWPVIDVTRRSIEETAATMLQLMEAWHERRRRAAEAPDAAPDGPPGPAAPA